MHSRKTAILGGGLTGLTLGYLLKSRGVEVEILEKEHECGGLMRSLHADGFTFDRSGTHIIFSKDERALNFMLKFLGKNVVRSRRNTKILYKGRLVKYPFENGLADLPKHDNYECLYHFVQNVIMKEKGALKPPKNLKSWFYYVFGKGIAEKYLIPYNEKIWKYPLDKIGLDWVSRIPNPPIDDVIKSALGIETEGYKHQLYFYYPKHGGIQALIDSLKDALRFNGVRVTECFEVKRICREDDVWVVSSGAEEREYDNIIATIPVHDLVRSLDAPENVINAASNLKYNSLITVMMGLDGRKNDISWLYIPDKDVLPHKVGFPSNYSRHVAPEGKSAVIAEITCNIGDEIWNMRDDDIAARTVEDLHRLGVIKKDEVCYINVERTKYAYVICDVEYKKNVNIVKNYLKSVGIDVVGRFAEFSYLNMDDCIRKAMEYCGSLR